ncbi:hypothetical protein [Glycomyces sp. YM15]|uniref:hypothetical protein n=1 Tax=Glycomyces sp. YM15 TaxID=2800446 RepID=UPI0019639694|nr:hypothetical protein [Glycomyces sp. YM15]
MPEVPTFAEPSGTTYTVRYHRARLLAVAVGCFLLWCVLSVASKQAPFHWANLLMVPSASMLCMSILCVSAPFHQPYLTLDSAGRVLRGPGGWWWCRSYPRRGRTGVTYSMQEGWIVEASADGTRRLPLPRWWAHSDDWTELDGLLSGCERSAPDWIHIRRTGPDWLPPSSAAIRIGSNRKPFLWAFLTGFTLNLAGCVGLPLLRLVQESYSLFVVLPSMLTSFGLVMLLFNQVAVFDPQQGTLVVKGRMSGGRVFPRRGYDHLEYSARLDAIHEVRADGKRRLVTGSWQFDPKTWKHFTDLIQERVR